MQISKILDHIQRKIQDNSYEREADLLPLVNDGLGEVAAMVPLPDLTTTNTVDCGDGYTVSMPQDFHSHFLFAYNTTRGRKITTIDHLTDFLHLFPSLDNSGSVSHVCAHGKTLYFQNTPGSSTPETVRIAYSKKPTEFTQDNDEEIDYIPKSLQKELLVNYVCREVYLEIEDGMENTKVNWNTHNKLFQQAISRLQGFVGLPPKNPEFVQDTLHGAGYFESAETGFGYYDGDIDNELI